MPRRLPVATPAPGWLGCSRCDGSTAVTPLRVAHFFIESLFFWKSAHSFLSILPSLFVSAASKFVTRRGSRTASFLSMNPSLFASSLANSAALSSVFVAGAAPGEVCAPAGSDAINPAPPRSASAKPDPMSIFLACIVELLCKVVDGDRNRSHRYIQDQVACQ